MKVLDELFNTDNEIVCNENSSLSIESTSNVTASVEPIILSQSKKNLTRTILQAKLVDNPNDESKSVECKLIYEKRKKDDNYPTEKICPQNIRAGELMELSLDTTATFRLTSKLNNLYEIHKRDGIIRGKTTYKEISDALNLVIEALNNNFHISNQDDLQSLKNLFDIVLKKFSIKSLTDVLKNSNLEETKRLYETLNIVRLDNIISIMEDNLKNSNEEFWQKNIFKDNQWILSQIFASPCTIFDDKVYVGGKGYDNKGGKVCDFIYQNQISKNVALIEIKTPKTEIFSGNYRQTYNFSAEFTGAINQVLQYKDSLMKEYYSLKAKSDNKFLAFNPKCVLIIGTINSLNSGQIATLENYRNSLKDVEIITFDEIIERLKNLKAIFKDEETSMLVDLDDIF